MATLFLLLMLAKSWKLHQLLSQINQLFQLLNLIWAYSDAFYGLTCMLISESVNNDISKDLPITSMIVYVQFIYNNY